MYRCMYLFSKKMIINEEIILIHICFLNVLFFKMKI